MCTSAPIAFTQSTQATSVCAALHINAPRTRMQTTKYSSLHPAFAIYEVVEPKAEMFLASAWMFRMTGDEIYKSDASARHAQVRRVGQRAAPACVAA